jgi:hypothetical protein
MVTAFPVHGAAGRITGKPAFKSGGLDALVELEIGVERFSRGAVRDQLYGLEQSASADVADMTVIAEAFG